MVIAGLMQFYFLGSAQFMQDMGISSKHVPASMALAQMAQAAATFFLLGLFLTRFEYKWTLVIGAGCWFLMYVLYIIGKPQALLVAGPAAAWPGVRVLHDCRDRFSRNPWRRKRSAVRCRP